MNKRGRFAGVSLEIFLMICMSFAVAFIWSESVGVVSALKTGDKFILNNKAVVVQGVSGGDVVYRAIDGSTSGSIPETTFKSIAVDYSNFKAGNSYNQDGTVYAGSNPNQEADYIVNAQGVILSKGGDDFVGNIETSTSPAPAQDPGPLGEQSRLPDLTSQSEIDKTEKLKTLESTQQDRGDGVALPRGPQGDSLAQNKPSTLPTGGGGGTNMEYLDINGVPVDKIGKADYLLNADGTYSKWEPGWFTGGEWEGRYKFENGKLVDVSAEEAAGKAKTEAKAPGGGGGGDSKAQGAWGMDGYMASGVKYAALVGGLVYLVAGAIGLQEGETNAIALAATTGVLIGTWAAGYTAQGNWGSEWLKNSIGAEWTGAIVGIAVAVTIFILMYSKEKEGTVVFSCKSWKAPGGGANCEACNNNPLQQCSEYRCRSLGAGCELLNAGTGKEACVHVTNNDVNSPTIAPWEEALRPRDLRYTNVNIRPPSLGMKIVKGGSNASITSSSAGGSAAQGGCLPAFVPLEFGLITNEAAQCKIDYKSTRNFSNMEYYFGESELYLYNHTHAMILPNAKTNTTDGNYKGPVLKNDGTYTLFVRCQDRNGNSNVDEFAINFCVDPSPDVTQPVILNTSIPSGGFVRFGVGSVPIDTYVNEWADCKWSTTSKAYSDMENSMVCPAMPIDRNAELNWVCSSNFTGIVDRQDNKYYIRCRDQPNQNDSSRNENTQSYELNLKGSQPLNILTVGPNETTYGSTSTIKTILRVVTDDGAQDGKAQCFFSNTGSNATYILMENTDTDKPEHTQELQLVTGNYKYYFRCVDAGGNAAEKNTAFSVFVDQEAPAVTRAYRDNGLKIVTNEDAECVYSLNNCNYNFAEGLKMQNSNPSIKTEHYTESKANAIYYIKCRDGYGNEPLPNVCNIIINGA